MAYVFPAEDTLSIKQRLEEIKTLHPKATHHCFAWRMGTGRDNFRAFDDGEPAGTAGKPILGQIDAAGLTNVLVVVVRYFGGAKLGVPGLITAYKSASREVIQTATVVEREIMAHMMVTIPFEQENLVYPAVARYRGKQLSRESSGNKVQFHIELPADMAEAFLASFPYLPGLQVSREDPV